MDDDRGLRRRLEEARVRWGDPLSRALTLWTGDPQIAARLAEPVLLEVSSVVDATLGRVLARAHRRWLDTVGQGAEPLIEATGDAWTDAERARWRQTRPERRRRRVLAALEGLPADKAAWIYLRFGLGLPADHVQRLLIALDAPSTRTTCHVDLDGPEPEPHPALAEILEAEPAGAILDHLAGCAGCSVEHRLITVREDDAPSLVDETIQWDTLAVLLDEGSASLVTGGSPSPSADGPLLAWEDSSGPSRVLTLADVTDTVRERFARTRGVAHPSLVSWRSLVEREHGGVAFCGPIPDEAVEVGLDAHPALAEGWARQLAAAVVALHRAGVAHGGIAEAFVGVDGTRVVLGPPSLTRTGSPHDDRRALGARLLGWANLASRPELRRLGESLRDGALSEDVDLLLALVELDRGPGPQGLRYETTVKLGQGGMGEVHRAIDHDLGRSVALKRLRPDSPLPPEVFLDEARITARLQHPGVVPVYEIGVFSDGRPFYTMEEVGGQRLDAVIRESRGTDSAWDRRRLLEVFVRICDTVAFAHDQGFVHRDLKPANVQIGDYGEVRVLDWGLATRIADPVAYSAYTPGYGAPEQTAGGRVDARADVHALGRILADILEGGPRTDLDDLVAACTAKDPDGRPLDGAAVGEAVRAWMSDAARSERANRAFEAAMPILDQAQELRTEATALRDRSSELLDDVPTWAPLRDRREGWTLEDEASRLEAQVAERETRYEQQLRTALDHDPAHRPALDAIGELYRERLTEAEREGASREVERLTILLQGHDGGRHRAWLTGDGAVTLVTDPPGAEVRLERFVEQDRRLVPVPERSLGTTPLVEVPLQRGSWLLRVRHPDREEVRYPVAIDREEHWHGVPPGETEPLPIWLPPAGALPEDGVYVPAGWFQSGDADAPDGLSRRQLWVDGFVIQREPMTTAQYLAILEVMMSAGRDVSGRVPRPTLQQEVQPLYTWNGTQWRPTEANAGAARLELGWPVTGISWHDARAIAAFLQQSRPWRLPHDQEWEKAGRGVDGRLYPFGNRNPESFVNLLGTRAGEPRSGPTIEHPFDESPYGVLGLAGGVRDWCRNRYDRGGPAHGTHILDRSRDAEPATPSSSPAADYRLVRGGCYVSTAAQARLASRLTIPPEAVERTIGLRFVANIL